MLLMNHTIHWFAPPGALVPMLEPGVPKAHSSQDMCAALTALGLGPSTVLHITNVGKTECNLACTSCSCYLNACHRSLSYICSVNEQHSALRSHNPVLPHLRFVQLAPFPILLGHSSCNHTCYQTLHCLLHQAYEAGKLGDMTSDDVVASVKGIMHTLRSLNGLDLAKVLEFGPGLLKVSCAASAIHTSLYSVCLPAACSFAMCVTPALSVSAVLWFNGNTVHIAKEQH